MKNSREIKFNTIPPFAQKQRVTKGGKFSARSGTYFGGSSSRRGTLGWRPPQGDADADTLTDRQSIINRSRDLVRNEPIATGAVNTKTLHTIGSGLTLHSRINRHILGISEETAQKKQNIIESEWKLFADNLDCSYDGRGNFNDNVTLVYRGIMESGDIFALLPFEMRNTSPYGLKIQLIESDRVCNKGNLRNTDRLTAGVHTNAKGKPVAYDIRTTHPGTEKGFSQKWDKVQALSPAGRRRVLHMFKQLRPGMTRGMPLFAPIIETIKQFSKYKNAEIAAAVINSYFTVFLKSPDGDTQLSPYAMTDETNVASDDQDYKLGNGAFITLSNDESVEFADPKRPNHNFEVFQNAMLKQIGTALEIPFEFLLYHFSASYSASRASFLLLWKSIKTDRAWLEAHFCNLVYDAWFEEAVLRNRIDAPGFLDDFAIRAAYLQNKWVGPNPGQIDPVKETTAALDRIGGRLTTIAGESAAIGEDFDQNIEQVAYEENKMKDLGVNYIGMGARGSAGVMGVNGPDVTPGGNQEDNDIDDDADDKNKGED